MGRSELRGPHFEAIRRHVEKLGRCVEGLARYNDLEFDRDACDEAGPMAADLMSRRETMATTDLFIAAVTRRHGQRLLTRDQAFARVRGLTIETY